MEHLLAHNTVSLAELREPEKVLAKAENMHVAVLNGNKAVAYLVPIGAVADITTAPLGNQELHNYITNDLPKIAHIIDYLKDK